MTAGIRDFVASTCDGSGGATAADGIDHYINGALNNGVATNNASYVAMEPGTGEVTLARYLASTNRLDGLMGLPFFTHRVLSAAEAFNLNDIYVAMQRPQRSPLLAGIF